MNPDFPPRQQMLLRDLGIELRPPVKTRDELIKNGMNLNAAIRKRHLARSYTTLCTLYYSTQPCFRIDRSE